MPNLPPLPRPRLRRSSTVGRSVAPDAVEVAEPRIVEASGLRWTHIDDPRLADREWLESRYEFHPLDWEDVYSRNQRSKLDVYDDYLFIVLHFPVF
jgi:magnesium transporter